MHSPDDLGGVYSSVEGLRSGGERFVMRPSARCPTVAELDQRAVRGSLLSYETAHVVPGTEDNFWMPSKAIGRRLQRGRLAIRGSETAAAF